jgi:chromate transporter
VSAARGNAPISERRIALREIAGVFLKIGAMSYGGPTIMGIMQAEIQEKRNWVAKPRFVEGLGLVNVLPGPGATQLAIFIGYAKAGLLGGILAGVCFILPAFLIMLALAAAYVAFGALPSARDAFYGIGPVVVGIFAASIYRLGKGVLNERSQIAICMAAAAAMLFAPVGLATVLLAAGCIGIAWFHSRRAGVTAFVLVLVASCVLGALLAPAAIPGPDAARQTDPASPGLGSLAIFFLKVGAFSFGGGLSILAFIQDQVVNQLAWLSPQEFIDGLALGQLTPGPILMLAAFVGFKLAGVTGAAVAASAIFLPSFMMMLSILPLLRKMDDLRWLKAFMRGVGPAVIGALGVSLVQIAPHAAPDLFSRCLLGLTIALILLRHVGPLPLMLGGGLAGLLRTSDSWERLAKWAR